MRPDHLSAARDYALAQRRESLRAFKPRSSTPHDVGAGFALWAAALLVTYFAVNVFAR